jgi:hypothetical protein
MKEISSEIDVRDGENNKVFSGTVVVKIPKRAERTSLQLAAMQMTADGKTDPEKYIGFSEKILNEHLISLDVVHVPSGETIKSREDLEYIEAEGLVSAICALVVGGKKLGKKNA